MNFYFREHWRIWMLVLFVAVSTVTIFGPAAVTLVEGEDGANGTDGVDEPTASKYTNLQFGLDLAGGTQVRAPLVGMTASGLEFDPADSREVEQTVRSELDLGAGDVRADGEEGTVEVYADEHVGNVTRAEFVAALEEAGLSAEEDDVEMGVTSSTRKSTEKGLEERIKSGLGGDVTQSTGPGQTFIVVEVPGANRTEVIDLVSDRGQVEIVALYPDPESGEYVTQSLADQNDFQTGTARQDQGETWVSISLEEEAGGEFGETMRELGFDQEGGTDCHYDRNRTLEENKQEDPGMCLMTVVDGEVVYAGGVAPDLASSFRSGSFDDDPTYRSLTSNFREANELETRIRAGALPTQLDIENRGTSFYLQPSLAAQFKPLSLATGAAAIGAVALVIFLRYRRREVAAPMLLTAAAEVYILLGFAALVQLPLDLSHIAGFIAVIGTGVDDLVIIADEIMQQGEVRTSRVFESRFKKAFWVIGAAAATTIVAMSPLAILSLGDLFGFAIVTIVGVLIGVLITRPAYGDILRILVLGGEN